MARVGAQLAFLPLCSPRRRAELVFEMASKTKLVARACVSVGAWCRFVKTPSLHHSVTLSGANESSVDKL